MSSKATKKKASKKKTAAKPKTTAQQRLPETGPKPVDAADKFFADLPDDELLPLALTEGVPMAQELARRLERAQQQLIGVRDALDAAAVSARTAAEQTRKALQVAS